MSAEIRGAAAVSSIGPKADTWPALPSAWTTSSGRPPKLPFGTRRQRGRAVEEFSSLAEAYSRSAGSRLADQHLWAAFATISMFRSAALLPDGWETGADGFDWHA